jgi:hypothetical protein
MLAKASSKLPDQTKDSDTKMATAVFLKQWETFNILNYMFRNLKSYVNTADSWLFS